jgi:hypothetical protein
MMERQRPRCIEFFGMDMIEKMEMILIEEELALVCGSFLLVLY